MNKYAFGDNLFPILKKNKLTQKSLAKMVGISENTMSDWCRGERFAPADKLYLISKAVGVSMDDLMKGCDDR